MCGALAIASTSIEHSGAAVGRDARGHYAAVAFDYFVLFNPDSVIADAERIAPGKGREFTDASSRSRTFTPTMLRANADRAGLTPLFDALVSTDSNHTYKPDPRAY